MRFVVATAMALMSLPTIAQARDYCSTRPSLGQSACTLDPGRVAVETALADWERDGGNDTVLFGDTLLRWGLTDRAEAQVAWTPVGISRDRFTGQRDVRAGDLEVGGRVALRGADGHWLSFGLQPSVTIPVGRDPIGGGGWAAGMVAPVTYDLNETLNLQFSPELSWEPRSAGRGHQIVPTATVGLGIALSEACDLTAEGQWSHDDIADHTRIALAVAFQLSPDLFIDAGGVAGLDDQTPAMRIYSGISRRF